MTQSNCRLFYLGSLLKGLLTSRFSYLNHEATEYLCGDNNIVSCCDLMKLYKVCMEYCQAEEIFTQLELNMSQDGPRLGVPTLLSVGGETEPLLVLGVAPLYYIVERCFETVANLLICWLTE